MVLVSGVNIEDQPLDLSIKSGRLSLWAPYDDPSPPPNFSSVTSETPSSSRCPETRIYSYNVRHQPPPLSYDSDYCGMTEPKSPQNQLHVNTASHLPPKLPWVPSDTFRKFTPSPKQSTMSKSSTPERRSPERVTSTSISSTANHTTNPFSEDFSDITPEFLAYAKRVFPKNSRPFKAYINGRLTKAESVLTPEDATKYQKYRRTLIEQMENESSDKINENKRRIFQLSPQNSDPTYQEKRKKNNIAAKRSRDIRKTYARELMIRQHFLLDAISRMEIKLEHCKQKRRNK